MRVVALASVLALVLCAPARAADVVTVRAWDTQFTAEQRAKLEEALALANRVLGSSELRAELGRIAKFNRSSDDGAAVHRKLLARGYTLRFEAVAQYAIRIGPIRRKSKMVASTGEGSGQITFNTVRMPEFDAAFYAGTIVHELCHIAGYHHDGNRQTTFNEGTVPYRVGELVRRLAEGLPPAPIPGGGLSGRLGGTSGGATPAPAPAPAPAPDADDSDADDSDADEPVAQGKPTFAARVRATFRRLFRRR